MSRKIIIGSRGSDLALWQANYAQEQLKKNGVGSEIKIIKTKGDKLQHLSFDKMEGKGFFTKELEDHLLDEKIDLAVHSHKDLPTASPRGLKIAAVSSREDPAELLLIRKDAVDELKPLRLKEKAVTGTSSPRRKSQLNLFRPDLEIKDLRGNVPTRIQKLRDGQYDAILVAFAGVCRLKLKLNDLDVQKFTPYYFIPAAAQGVLAYQIREGDDELQEILNKIEDHGVAATTAIERRVLNILEGGCSIPLGCYCTHEKNNWQVWATLALDANKSPRRLYMESDKPEGLPEIVVDRLKNNAAKHVFISREAEDCELFTELLETQQYKVTANSMIQFKAVPFKSIPDCDWIFFTSKNSVKFFFEQKGQIPDKVKLAVMGKGTEALLNKYGYQADFTGHSADTRSIAEELILVVSGQTVWFPVAKNSRKTIQQMIGEHARIEETVIYDNRPTENISIPDTDIAVLTSPMNARIYLEQVKDPPELVAIGSTTAQAIKKMGYGSKVAYLPEEMALADTVMGVL